MKSGYTNLSITEELSKLIQDYNFSLEAFKKNIFVEVFNIALKKFEKHINNHSSLELFKSIRCFDPKYIQAETTRQNIYLYSKILEFKNPSNDLLNEWSVYCNLQNDFLEDQEMNLDSYWKDLSRSLPVLSKIALIYIWLPVSGVDVERSFSAYKSILSDRRHSLSEESIAMLNFLYFNANTCS